VREALGIRSANDYQQWMKEQLPLWLEQAEIRGVDLLLEDQREV